jgi:hypothetical protein
MHRLRRLCGCLRRNGHNAETALMRPQEYKALQGWFENYPAGFTTRQ